MTLQKVDVAGRMTLATPAEGYRFDVEVDGLRSVLDSGPGHTALTPVQALLSALAGCQAMDVILILRKKRMVPASYTVEFRGERAAEHPRRFVGVEIVHRVSGPDVTRAGVEEAVRLSEEKYCSVHHTLRPDLVVTTRIEVDAG